MIGFDRALGTLTGLALGDALGMPTQSMSPAEIAEDYGPITDLVDAGPRQRIAAGLAAGSVTDDTDQALIIADLLIDGRGTIDSRIFAERLIAWEKRMTARGSLDLLGPSTTRAISRLRDGASVTEAGRTGSTNGAAMRIAPVGIATPLGDQSRFIDAVVNASTLTHNTSIGLAAAAAVGAAVSAGVGGGDTESAISAAISMAQAAESRGHWVAGGSIGARLRVAVDLLADAGAEERSGLLREVVGTSVASQESVVAALALVAVHDQDEPGASWTTLCAAAGLGGDTDTIAAMAGAVLGAVHGLGAWPTASVETVLRVNDLDLEPRARRLLDLRRSRYTGSPTGRHD